MDNIYRDIAERTGGNIYIGVAGPVRCGKSTFIKKFMEELVIPAIPGDAERTRARDELPQSASGRTVMTTEPKFVPEEAVSVVLSGGAKLNVRMVDCVGYMVEGALTGEDGESERTVETPWSDSPMPFSEAAETGTRKVISEHSTVGILVTSDGSIGDLPRSAFVPAEERVAKEMSDIGKPFAIILNSADPSNPETVNLGYELEKKYSAPVALVSCPLLDGEDIKRILELVLYQFPIKELKFRLPSWCSALPKEHRIRREIFDTLSKASAGLSRMGDLEKQRDSIAGGELFESVSGLSMDMGCGKAEVSVKMPDRLYYSVIEEMTGIRVSGEEEMISALISLSAAKKKYDRVTGALEDAEKSGYGIVMPEIDELKLEEPQIVRQAGGYGVRLRAAAPSIHMIRANIETEINPVVGTEEQSEELVRFMLKEFEEDPGSIWKSNMFGKTLYELVGEGLNSKLTHIPNESRAKLGETLERIINEGSGGLICILL